MTTLKKKVKNKMTTRSTYVMFCQRLLLIFLVSTPLIRSPMADDAPLQDLCPAADGSSPTPHINFNGLWCKNPANITATDFRSSGLTHRGNTTNFLHSSEVVLTAGKFPGLNTLGLALGRTDLGPDGVVLPHAHPRASEMMYVTRGAVIAGFVDSDGRLFKAVVSKGGIFVFPRGLLHFYLNANHGNDATAISFFNSQNPGTTGPPPASSCLTVFS